MKASDASKKLYDASFMTVSSDNGSPPTVKAADEGCFPFHGKLAQTKRNRKFSVPFQLEVGQTSTFSLENTKLTNQINLIL